MLPRLLAIGGSLLALAPAASAAAPCPVEPLPAETLEAGDQAVDR